MISDVWTCPVCPLVQPRRTNQSKGQKSILGSFSKTHKCLVTFQSLKDGELGLKQKITRVLLSHLTQWMIFFMAAILTSKSRTLAFLISLIKPQPESNGACISNACVKVKMAAGKKVRSGFASTKLNRVGGKTTKLFWLVSCCSLYRLSCSYLPSGKTGFLW